MGIREPLGLVSRDVVLWSASSRTLIVGCKFVRFSSSSFGSFIPFFGWKVFLPLVKPLSTVISLRLGSVASLTFRRYFRIRAECSSNVSYIDLLELKFASISSFAELTLATLGSSRGSRCLAEGPRRILPYESWSTNTYFLKNLDVMVLNVVLRRREYHPERRAEVLAKVR